MVDEGTGKRRKKQSGKAAEVPVDEEPELPPHLELQRTHVVTGADINANVRLNGFNFCLDVQRPYASCYIPMRIHCSKH